MLLCKNVENRCKNTEGSLVAELVVLIPFLLAIIFTFVIAMRVERASILLRSEAKDAAQLATIAENSSSASDLVDSRVGAELADQGVYCTGGPRISIDFSNYHPGGSVSVKVVCNVSLIGLLPMGLGSTVTESAAATAPIDPYVSQSGS